MVDHLVRTRLAKEIICEVAFPERQQGKVAILCGGAPGYPPGKKVLSFLASKGYVAFGLRYRGTWESEGNFLKYSPAKDVKDAITYLIKNKGIIDAWSGQKIPVKIKHFDLFGASFGGPAVLLNSKTEKVRKVIAITPVVDFRKSGPGETWQKFLQFTKEGFGDAYRTQKSSDWQKLLKTDFYNPVTMVDIISPKKCFILQTLDDDVCIPENTRTFEEKTGVEVYYKPKGGHFGLSIMTHGFYWRKISQFLG